ncbi:MAG: VRR-NUC domain-containing protein [Thermoplasmata archaeon]
MLIKDGKVEGFVEVKGPKHGFHSPQRRTLEELRKLGFRVAVARVMKGDVDGELL